MRKQKAKLLPSGGTPNEFYSRPDRYGGENCLIPVDEAAIEELLARPEAQRGLEKMRWVDDAYNELCHQVYKQIGSPEIILSSAWKVFQDMINVIGDDEA